VDGHVISRDAALGHHLFEVSKAELVGQVPQDAEQDHGSIKMPALEHAAHRH
jgi:hypothetical protein